MKGRPAEYKPLSFTTTLRNPERIKDFLKILAQYEGMNMTDSVIMCVVRDLIRKQLYTPMYVSRIERLKIKTQIDEYFTDEEVNEIIDNSPQKHKEAGFEWGWPSRFDTWYKFPMELGFIYYAMNKPIEISATGHMLIESEDESIKEHQVYANALVKYQTNNPFRKVLNENVPFVLFLQVLNMLKDDKEEPDAGISKHEIPLFICWRDNNAKALYEMIKSVREKWGFGVSDEAIYDICLEQLGATSDDENRFKMNKIAKESTDEFIRKMKYTGLITLRGFGRFVDVNMIEINKIKYILENYMLYEKYFDSYSYFKYMGTMDTEIINIETQAVVPRIDVIDSLDKWVDYYDWEVITKELRVVCAAQPCKDDVLKFINGPLRLEFLTSIALKKKFNKLIVKPNYTIDDEGLPTSHAGGGVADIECFDIEYNSLFEVTLLTGTQQNIREMPSICRHLKTAKETNGNTFSVLVTPRLHPDTTEYAKFAKFKDDLDVLTFGINDFISKIESIDQMSSILIS